MKYQSLISALAIAISGCTSGIEEGGTAATKQSLTIPVSYEDAGDDEYYRPRPGPVLSCQMQSGQHLYEEEFTCPIGGEKFKSLVLGTHSTYGRYLDWEPVSYLEFPTPVPVCPSNGFVVYKDDFSDDELATFGRIIQSDAYRKDFAAKNTSYYLFARLLELSENIKDYDLWWIYLQSTWEADLCKSGKYTDYAKQTIKFAQDALSSYSDDDSMYWLLNIIIPNLYRRIGEFESAGQWLSDLGDKRPDESNEFYESFILAHSLLTKAIKEKRTEQIELKAPGEDQ